MRKYFVFIVLFFLIGGIGTQVHAKFGVKAGVNMSNVSLDQNASELFKPENLTGFQIGPMFETISGLGLGLDVAVLYSQIGFKNALENEAYKLNTLQVPVNLKLKVGVIPKMLKAYGSAGPYANFNLSGKLMKQIETKSFGIGLNFGFGVELLSHLQIGANYQVGLTNELGTFNLDPKNLDLKGKPTVWSITAAYLF